MIRMAIQIVLIDEAAGRPEIHEIVRIDRQQLSPETLGPDIEMRLSSTFRNFVISAA
jgi:hypothetical protein